MALIDASAQTLADIPTNDRIYARFGLLFLLCTFGVLGLWAAVVPLDSAASAGGQVEVASARKTIQHLEGGIVAAIEVDDGDVVAAGDPLVRLDTTQVKAELEAVRLKLWTSLARLARLEVERRQANSIEFPTALLQHEDRPQVQQMMTTQLQELQARREALSSEIEAGEQRIEQLREQISGVRQQMKAEQALVQSYREEVEEMRGLYERRMIEKDKLRRAERQLHTTRGDLNEHRAEVAELAASIKEQELQIIRARREFHKSVMASYQQTESTIMEARTRLGALEDKLKRTTIQAPVGGEVVGLKIHTIGAVIRPGEPIMDLVPTEDQMIIKARVSPDDIDDVRRGLAAEVWFTAFNTYINEPVAAEVITVSADALTDEKTGDTYFEAILQVTAAGLETMRQQEITAQPGMPASVLIKTGQRTLMNYLLQPFAEAFRYALREP